MKDLQIQSCVFADLIPKFRMLPA